MILADKQGFLGEYRRTSIGDAFFESEREKESGTSLNSPPCSCGSTKVTRRCAAAIQPAWTIFFSSTRPYIQNPNGTFHNSYTNTLFWKLLTAEFRLQESFTFANRMQPDNARLVGQLFDELPNPDYSAPEFFEAHPI